MCFSLPAVSCAPRDLTTPRDDVSSPVVFCSLQQDIGLLVVSAVTLIVSALYAMWWTLRRLPDQHDGLQPPKAGYLPRTPLAVRVHSLSVQDRRMATMTDLHEPLHKQASSFTFNTDAHSLDSTTPILLQRSLSYRHPALRKADEMETAPAP